MSFQTKLRLILKDFVCNLQKGGNFKYCWTTQTCPGLLVGQTSFQVFAGLAGFLKLPCHSIPWIQLLLLRVSIQLRIAKIFVQASLPHPASSANLLSSAECHNPHGTSPGRSEIAGCGQSEKYLFKKKLHIVHCQVLVLCSLISCQAAWAFALPP